MSYMDIKQCERKGITPPPDDDDIITTEFKAETDIMTKEQVRDIALQYINKIRRDKINMIMNEIVKHARVGEFSCTHIFLEMNTEMFEYVTKVFTEKGFNVTRELSTIKISWD